VKTKAEQQHAGRDKIRKVHEFLQSESTLVLSTKGADGAVHSAPLFYLPAENLDLMWLSSGDTRHSEHVRVEPRVSVAVFRSTFEWRKIAGVQMDGQCSIIDGSERSPILDAYCSRFQLGTALSFTVSKSLLYRFRPRWIRYIENQRRLGYKFEIVL
jgi:uncharacterized protein YhbP (UPF0306 family)